MLRIITISILVVFVGCRSNLSTNEHLQPSKIQELTNQLQSYDGIDKGRLYYDRGLEFYHLDSLRNASDDFISAIKNGYENDTVYYYLGWSLNKTGHFKDVINIANSRIKISDKNPQMYMIRAGANIMMGDTTAACADLIIAKSLGDTLAEKGLYDYCK